MDIRGYANDMKKKLEEELSAPLNIALFGQPGAGKSSLINALVGSNEATVGVTTDQTKKAQIVPWNQLVLVDLPGYGTSTFPPNQFFDKFNIHDYMLFLCVFSGKFHQADSEFFLTLQNEGKVCLFVRNKVDDVWDPVQSLENLKKQIQLDLNHHIHPNSSQIHFTRCRPPVEGIEDLAKAVLGNLDEANRRKWLRSAKAYSHDFLEQKKQACYKVIWISCGLAAINSINPIPGVDISVDLGILLILFKQLRDIYGLTEEKIQSSAALYPTFGPLIENIVKYSTREGLLLLLKRFASQEVAKSISKYVPLVGQAIAASIGFGITKTAGEHYLEDCHTLAKQILDNELTRR